MLGAACLLLALGARADTAADSLLTTLGSDAATLELDVPEAPTTDAVVGTNITDDGAGSGGVPAGGRKLLGVPQYLIKGGGPKGGYVACQRGRAQVLLCYGTPDKAKAARFVVYQYNDMYQFQMAGTGYCLTLFSKPQNQVCVQELRDREGEPSCKSSSGTARAATPPACITDDAPTPPLVPAAGAPLLLRQAPGGRVVPALEPVQDPEQGTLHHPHGPQAVGLGAVVPRPRQAPGGARRLQPRDLPGVQRGRGAGVSARSWWRTV